MKRIVLWLMSTFTVVVLLFGYRTSTNTTTAAAASPVSKYSATAPATAGTTTSTTQAAAGNTVTGGTTSTGTSTPSTGTSTSTAASTSDASTTYDGTVAQTRWGPVQVEITVTGGTITAVDVLQYPSGNGKDQQINARALPVLVQETIEAQSAQVDMVSGATVTSDGYLESLQSALDQAGL